MAITIDHQDAKFGSFGFVGSSRMNQRTYDAVIKAAKMTGTDGTAWGSVRFTQGGLNAGAVAASAHTHDGLDVVDIAIDGRSQTTVFHFVKWLLRCGVIAFPRGYVDNFKKHIHGVVAKPDFAHDEAQQQVSDYRDSGGNGLPGAPGPYFGPDVPFVTWEACDFNPKNELDPEEKEFDVATVHDVLFSQVIDNPEATPDNQKVSVADLLTRISNIVLVAKRDVDSLQANTATKQQVAALMKEVDTTEEGIAALRSEVAALKAAVNAAPGG